MPDHRLLGLLRSLKQQSQELQSKIELARLCRSSFDELPEECDCASRLHRSNLHPCLGLRWHFVGRARLRSQHFNQRRPARFALSEPQLAGNVFSRGPGTFRMFRMCRTFRACRTRFRRICGQTCSERSERSKHEHCSGPTQM